VRASEKTRKGNSAMMSSRILNNSLS